MTGIVSFSMYFTSFLPLWITVLFIDIKALTEEKNASVFTEIISLFVITILFIICTIVLFKVLNPSDSTAREKYRLTEAKESKTITSEFLLSYILPLFAFDFTRWDGMVEFLIFFLILGYLCIHHSFLSVNLLMEFMNYKMYICKLENGDKVIVEKIVVSKKSLNVNRGCELFTTTLNNEYLLDTDD